MQRVVTDTVVGHARSLARSHTTRQHSNLSGDIKRLFERCRATLDTNAYTVVVKSSRSAMSRTYRERRNHPYHHPPGTIGSGKLHHWSQIRNRTKRCPQLLFAFASRRPPRETTAVRSPPAPYRLQFERCHMWYFNRKHDRIPPTGFRNSAAHIFPTPCVRQFPPP